MKKYGAGLLGCFFPLVAFVSISSWWSRLFS